MGIAYLGGKFWGFWVKIGEGIFGFRPQSIVLPFRTPKVLAKFREDWLKNATVGVSTDTYMYIHTRLHRRTTDLIICLRVSCYGIAMGQINIR